MIIIFFIIIIISINNKNIISFHVSHNNTTTRTSTIQTWSMQCVDVAGYPFLPAYLNPASLGPTISTSHPSSLIIEMVC